MKRELIENKGIPASLLWILAIIAGIRWLTYIITSRYLTVSVRILAYPSLLLILSR